MKNKFLLQLYFIHSSLQCSKKAWLYFEGKIWILTQHTTLPQIPWVFMFYSIVIYQKCHSPKQLFYQPTTCALRVWIEKLLHLNSILSLQNHWFTPPIRWKIKHFVQVIKLQELSTWSIRLDVHRILVTSAFWWAIYIYLKYWFCMPSLSCSLSMLLQCIIDNKI